ncbi:hypothetical protein ACF08W_29080 [Streptomyces sp. NPDC015144]|uniref:hypothetical protein n=1 Tax=Streptomyces sp. NPDC015144 TaxID=3364944 RepID=UPI0037015B64
MTNDVTDSAQGDEKVAALPLTTLGLIGAVAKAMTEHQTAVIAPKVSAPKKSLVAEFLERKQSDLVIEIGGEEVGHYKVNLTKDRFEVADEKAFDAYAEDKGEYDVIIVRKPSFEKAVLAHAQRDPETGAIFDSRSGEIIPGLKFVPGGKPTGTVTWTWKTFKKQPIGKAVLMAALRRGELDELLREAPELLPKAQPGARDE